MVTSKRRRFLFNFLAFYDNCFSPDDKRKIVHIGDTSTKFHVSNFVIVCNDMELRSTLDPNLFTSYGPMKTFHVSYREPQGTQFVKNTT